MQSNKKLNHNEKCISEFLLIQKTIPFTLIGEVLTARLKQTNKRTENEMNTDKSVKSSHVTSHQVTSLTSKSKSSLRSANRESTSLPTIIKIKTK